MKTINLQPTDLNLVDAYHSPWPMSRMNEIDSIHPADIEPHTVRYVKLGPGGRWFRRCVEDGLIEIGHAAVPHEVASKGDWDGAQRLLQAEGYGLAKARDFIREIRDFYTIGSDALWIAIGDGKLWWGFADEEVFAIDEPERGARGRRMRGGWKNCDLGGAPLDLSSLSTRLTKVAAYRQTICAVEAKDYLVRRINGIEEPAVLAARAAQASVIAAAEQLIQALDWRDFELLVDLIFAQSGWRRTSAVGGGDQADTDLLLEQSATGERAWVQVKSRADRAVLTDYIGRFQRSGADRMFFVCHTAVSGLADPQLPGIHIWLGDKLAKQATRAGLIEWLIEKTR